MMSLSTRLPLTVMLLGACHCASVAGVDTDSESGSAEGSIDGSSGQESTGTPFDASRWIGRYHLESYLLPFGERGDPQGDFSLANFEVFADSRAVLLYDECAFEAPVVIVYEWSPSEDGWLTLSPGGGESSLRYKAAEDLETLRVRLIEPCRELRFEVDGREDGLSPFLPGESCWVDRCTTPGIMQADYCEGEQPSQCP